MPVKSEPVPVESEKPEDKEKDDTTGRFRPFGSDSLCQLLSEKMSGAGLTHDKL